MSTVDDDLPMKPLQASWAVDDVEDELRDLFIALYDQVLRETADEINVYGAPHLGSISLVQREVTADGLSIINQGDNDGIRYLFKAFRNLNPERGMHFLRTYLRVLWGDNQNIHQLWQKKSETYPTYLRSKSEIVGSETDYFLTSRLRVELDIEDILPETIIQSLKTAIAARFVLMFRIAKFMRTDGGMASVARGVVIARLSGETIEPSGLLFQTGMAHVMGGMVLAYTSAE